ncbi:MAG TPA: hypothetical protein VIT64_15665 [Ilumatobacteraceae bacterium]
MSGSTPGHRAMLGVGSLLVAGGFAFGVLSPPEHCPEVTSAGLRQAASEAVDWFARNQNADGTWLYQYRAETDTVVDDYNVVRHAGAVMGLYMAADYGIEEGFALADRGLEWSRDGLVRDDDWAAVGTVRGDPSTGGTALLLAGLADRRSQTGDTREDELMVGLAQFLVAQTEPSGAVLATYDMATGAPVPGVYSKYYTGEAYWALALMAQQVPDGPWGEVADRIGAYMATQRDVAEDQWPPLPDHWAAYGLADTAASGDADHDRALTDDEVAYARRQAGLFAAAVRWVGQQAGPWGPAVRGPQEPRGGGYGVIGEGLTGLWRVAVVEPPMADMRDAIGARAMCIAGMAIDEQIDASEAAAFAAPSRVQGAWFIEGETRMDDQQHALSALVRTMSIADADTADGVGARGDVPSVWLWILALVAAFNPARVALGVPSPSGREAERRRERTVIAAIGVAVGSVVLLAVAGVSDALLDAFYVSAPAFRIAAGIVGAAAGAYAMFVRHRSDLPVLPGRRAALVPVAVPLVVNAAAFLFAISAAADRGLPVVLGAIIAGSLLAVAATVVPAGGTADRSLGLVARATGGFLLLAGVLLVIDGVFSV